VYLDAKATSAELELDFLSCMMFSLERERILAAMLDSSAKDKRHQRSQSQDVFEFVSQVREVTDPCGLFV